jgi:putative ATP-binding cassette transporter
MADQSSKAPASAGGEAAVEDGLKSELVMMVRAFAASAERGKLVMLAVAIAIVIGATAYGQIRLNAWNQPFYDALARKDFEAFVSQLVVFLFIAAGLLILNVAQVWLNQMTKLKLRQGLVNDLIDQWLEPKRAFRLAGAGEIGVNPDQRIHEDARHLTELSTDLGIGLFQATLLLLSFVGVLWVLSDNVIFKFHDRSFSIPGYMVWCALLYAVTGSLVSWRVGRPLIPLTAERYAREADLRFALMRVNEHADGIALHGGEADEKQHLRNSLDRVLGVMRQLVTGVMRLTWVTAGYGWFAIVAPILVAAPAFFGGDMTIGGLMVVVGAFTQVQQALRWFVDNFNTIADWLATLRRVASFRRALVDMDKMGHDVGRIEFDQAPDGRTAFDNLAVALPGGGAALGETQVEIDHGERVLIMGEAGAGLTTLFRAIAGLWPWGTGRISLPAPGDRMFMPQRPYIPLGSLRDALAYPSAATEFAEDALIAACKRVGLTHLSTELDRRANWDNELASDELQRLAFARLLLHKPKWICVNEAADSLDRSEREELLTIFDNELAGAAIISLGHHDPREGFSIRVLHLVKDPEGPRLTPYVDPNAPKPTADAAAPTA